MGGLTLSCRAAFGRSSRKVAKLVALTAATATGMYLLGGTSQAALGQHRLEVFECGASQWQDLVAGDLVTFQHGIGEIVPFVVEVAAGGGPEGIRQRLSLVQYDMGV